jgi:hypothetical protein
MAMKIEATPRRGPAATTTAGAFALGEATTFLLAAMLHLGASIPLGFAVLAEPFILPAAIVEGLCGLGLAVAGVALLTRRAWAWPAAVGAHAFAIAGVLLGVFALAAGRGPTTDLNTIYHRTMLAILAAALVWLATPAARAALGRGRPTT